jgi:transketolase
MNRRWQAFGWDTIEIDGHSESSLLQAVSDSDLRPGRPHVILARTVFGSGVTFMEGQIKWHYSPLSTDEHAEALRSIEALR